MHKEGNEQLFILLINIWLLFLPPLYILWTKIHYHVTTMECDITWCKHSSQTDVLSIWSSTKYKNTYMYNQHGHNENWHDLQHSWFLWRSEGHWDTFWWSSISDVSVRELPLELARPNYINGQIETFERILVMQKALVKFKHHKLVFVKFESSFTRNI